MQGSHGLNGQPEERVWLGEASVRTHNVRVLSCHLFPSEAFCSYPTQACTQLTNSTTWTPLWLTYAFIGTPGNGIPTASCFDGTTLLFRGLASDPGMTFEILARVQTTPPNLANCSTISNGNATIAVSGATSAWITWVGGTNFDQNAGDASHGFSFKGPDPHGSLVGLLEKATSNSTSYSSRLEEHISDVASGLSTNSPFQLSIGQQPSFTQSTDELVAAYTVDTGNPYLEWLAFHLGRYMLFSSARGSLPANLQGKWARDSSNPYVQEASFIYTINVSSVTVGVQVGSADFDSCCLSRRQLSTDYRMILLMIDRVQRFNLMPLDSNINIQMNYWSAESTSLDVTASLWDYMEVEDFFL